MEKKGRVVGKENTGISINHEGTLTLYSTHILLHSGVPKMSFSTKAILTFSIKALLVLLTANVCLLHEVQSEASHFQHALKFVGPVSVLAANVKIPVGRIIEFKREDGVTEGKLDENTEKRIENTEKRIDNLEKRVSILNITLSDLVSNLQEKGLVPTLTPTSNPTQTTIAPTTSPTSNPTQTTIAPTTSPTANPTQTTIAPTTSPTSSPTQGKFYYDNMT